LRLLPDFRRFDQFLAGFKEVARATLSAARSYRKPGRMTTKARPASFSASCRCGRESGGSVASSALRANSPDDSVSPLAADARAA
jgi:hypothetical protein